MAKNRLAPRGTMSAAPGYVLRPVYAVDVDGTLAVWHNEFLRFSLRWLGVDRVSKTRGDHTWYDFRGGSLAQHMGVTKAVFREIKLAFRQSGLKRDMLLYQDAAQFTKYVRAMGAELWICSTRPYLRLDNIDPDTREWLRRSRIAYDGVLYGDRKYADLRRLVGKGRVVGVLDDLPEQIEHALALGLPGRLICRPHNRTHHERLPTLKGFWPAIHHLEVDLKEWKEVHNVR